MTGFNRCQPWRWLMPLISVAVAGGACSVYGMARSWQLNNMAWVEYTSGGDNFELNWRSLEVTDGCGCFSSRVSRQEARVMDADAKPVDPKERERVLRSVGEEALLLGAPAKSMKSTYRRP